MVRDAARWTVVGVVVASVVVYAAIGAYQHRWPSVVTGAVLVVLLASAHRRARFAAYIFFPAVAIRGVLVGNWALPLSAGVVLVVMQTAPARRAGPRLARGRLFGGDGRMRRS